MHDLDLSAFHWINGWSNSYAPFYDFLSEGNKMWPVRIVALALIIALIAAGPKTRRAAIVAIVAVLLSNGLTDILKHSIHFNRPCVDLAAPDIINHGVGFLTSYGTASAHAANTAAIAVAFTWFLRWWGVIPILISLFTGLARIYVGVHYPSQVLLGWICGTAVCFVVISVWHQIEKRRAASAEEAVNSDAAGGG